LPTLLCEDALKDLLCVQGLDPWLHTVAEKIEQLSLNELVEHFSFPGEVTDLAPDAALIAA